MRLQVGIGSFRELDYFLSAGADEFYCGLSAIPSHVEGARNFSNEEEILKAAAQARAAGRRMFFAANEVHAGLLASTAAVIKRLAAGGVDGVIVKDLALLDLLRRRRVKTPIILSTLACCLNAAALGFYRRYGVARLALPEQLTAAEAAELVRNPWGIESEVFLKSRECCLNFNGLCFLDCRGGLSNACRKEYRAGKKAFRMPAVTPEEHLGELHDYYRLGVQTLKVGRSPCEPMSKLIFKESAALAALLKAGAGRAAFVREGLRVRRAFDRAYALVRRTL